MPALSRRLVTAFVGTLTLLACAAPSPAQPVDELNAAAGVALHGYDPVAYFRSGTATPGAPEHSFVWRGVRWQFASAEHRSLFEADPEAYAPRYGGYCAYAMSLNRIADVDPEAWEVVDGKLYLNNNKAVHTLWKLRSGSHIAKGDRNWSAYPKRDVMPMPEGGMHDTMKGGLE